MFKIGRIKVRIRGNAMVSNDHQAINLARAIGESLAEKKGVHKGKIERIGLSHPASAATHKETLADGITSRIINQLRKP